MLECSVPESAFLGLKPGELECAEGPLILSALRVDPPERSVQFHLSLASLSDEGKVSALNPPPSAGDVRTVMQAASRLNTEKLTIVAGDGVVHGLVWEPGSLDMHTHSIDTVVGGEIAQKLPEGDGEKQFRRFIEDSVDLLSTLELNRRRTDEGFPPLNLLWPWGQGMRPIAPNLAIKRGTAATFVSRSMRLRGLTRLVGYAHAPSDWLGNGFNFNVAELFDRVRGFQKGVIVLDSFSRLRAAERVDEGEWLMREIDNKFFSQWAGPSAKELGRLAVFMPGGWSHPSMPPSDASVTGLAMIFDPSRKESSTVPMDERALDDARLTTKNLWELIENEL
jgi:hypothetical protein